MSLVLQKDPEKNESGLVVAQVLAMAKHRARGIRVCWPDPEVEAARPEGLRVDRCPSFVEYRSMDSPIYFAKNIRLSM